MRRTLALALLAAGCASAPGAKGPEAQADACAALLGRAYFREAGTTHVLVADFSLADRLLPRVEAERARAEKADVGGRMPVQPLEIARLSCAVEATTRALDRVRGSGTIIEAALLSDLGWARYELGDYRAAEELSAQAVVVDEKVGRVHPSDLRHPPRPARADDGAEGEPPWRAGALPPQPLHRRGRAGRGAPGDRPALARRGLGAQGGRRASTSTRRRAGDRGGGGRRRLQGGGVPCVTASERRPHPIRAPLEHERPAPAPRRAGGRGTGARMS